MNLDRSEKGRRLAIRADASIDVGAGHVMRCLALAEAWNRSGGESDLFTVAPPPLVEAAAKRVAVRVRSCASAGEAWTAIVGWTRANADAWAVLDSYDLGREARDTIRAAGARLLVIDDCATDANVHCDLLLNQSIGADALGYRVEKATRCCFGPTYALIRAEFRQQRSIRRFDASASRLVVTFGGADAHNQAARVARLLAGAVPPLEATIVAGQAHPDGGPEIASRSGVQIKWRTPGDGMASVLAAADLAICAAGTTCWELACLGVPALTMVVADNQCRVAAAMGEAGINRSLGWFNAVSDGELATAIETMRRDDARGEMSRRGRALVDGLGANRVVEAMRAVVVA